MILPDYVFFSEKEYNSFRRGELKRGAKFSVGVTTSVTLVMTVNAIGDDFYECIDNKGTIHAIDWDVEEFGKKQTLRKQNKWAFYKIINIF